MADLELSRSTWQGASVQLLTQRERERELESLSVVFGLVMEQGLTSQSRKDSWSLLVPPPFRGEGFGDSVTLAAGHKWPLVAIQSGLMA